VVFINGMIKFQEILKRKDFLRKLFYTGIEEALLMHLENGLKLFLKPKKQNFQLN